MQVIGHSIPSPASGHARALAALGTAALAMLALVTAVVPNFEGLLGLEGGKGLALCRLLAAAAAAALLALAWGLWRGKRSALYLIVGALLAGAALGAADGASVVATMAEVAAALVMLASRTAFERGGTGRGGRRAGLTVAVAALSAYALAAAPAMTTAGAPGPWPSLESAGASLASGSWWLRSGTPIGLALDGLLVVAFVGGGVLLRSLLSAAPGEEGHSPVAHARAAEIVRAYASDSLDPFALRADKSFHFAHGGLLAYRVMRETAVVAGDPIGPPGSAPAIVADFRQLASRRGWEVVITGASAKHLAAYEELGYRAVRIGNEAIVDSRGFSLEGRAIRKVRQSVSRLRRLGWTVEVLDARELTDAAVADLAAVDVAWAASQPRIYGFAMTLGRLWGAEEDEDSVYVLARDSDGRLRSFLRFAQYNGGLSLDVMRRGGSDPNGVNEAMVVAALEHARREGIREVSLNFAGFAHVMVSGAQLTPAQRLLRRILRALHGRFQLERLVRFNDKFLPEWRTRYLLHEGGPGLPLGGWRVLQAEAYLRPPRCRRRTASWQPLPLPVRASKEGRGTRDEGLVVT